MDTPLETILKLLCVTAEASGVSHKEIEEILESGLP